MFGDSFGSFGDMFQAIFKDTAGRAQLRIWFKSKAGQHEPNCGRTQKGDLLRMNGNAGLPTIRLDLADQVEKITVTRGEELLKFVWKKLSPKQRLDLERFTSKG